MGPRRGEIIPHSGPKRIPPERVCFGVNRSEPVSRVLLPARGRVRGHPSGTKVALRLMQPTRRHRTGRPRSSPYLALLRVGFTKPIRSPGPLVRSYRTFSPLLRTKVRGGLFSVALSLGSPPVDVIHHPALRSPDFPPAAQVRARPRGPLRFIVKCTLNSG